MLTSKIEVRVGECGASWEEVWVVGGAEAMGGRVRTRNEDDGLLQRQTQSQAVGKVGLERGEDERQRRGALRLSRKIGVGRRVGEIEAGVG